MNLKGNVARSLVIVFLILTSRFLAAQQTENISPAGTRFFLYTPPGYPSQGPYPLLLSLHGQVGIGNDLEEILKSQDHSPAKLIHLNRWPQDRPFIVLSPQLKRDPAIPDPRDQNWDPKAIDEVLEHVKTNYDVDPNRIYVVGLSLGATGVWLYAAAYAEKVAAMVAMSGVPDSTTGCFVKDIPSWVFHGQDDGLIVPRFATGMVNAINSCQPRGRYVAHLTMMEARRHDGLWSDVYNYTSGHRIYEWLLQFRKGDHSNHAPYVNAGNDLKILNRSAPLHLNGYFFDSDGTVAKVEWKQTMGPTLNIQKQDGFLKISDLIAGTFEFELSVTDNDGATGTDRVAVQVLDQAGDLPQVIDLVLLNNKTEREVGKLYDGYVINPDHLGTRRINIRAEANAAALSVRFRISDDHNTRTKNTPGPFIITGREWEVRNGEYLVCATPYDDRGARGNTGISQCYKIIVANEGGDPPDDGEEPTHFYAMEGSDIGSLASWKSRPDGSGESPESFATTGQVFEIRAEVFLNGPLDLDPSSQLVIADGGILHLNSAPNVPITLEKNARVIVNTAETIVFGDIDPESYVVMESKATVVPMAAFGNLVLRGSGVEKTLSAGTTLVQGNLLIADDTPVNGNAGSPSTLELKGDVTLEENDLFGTTPRIRLLFSGGHAQRLSYQAGHIAFEKISISAGTLLQLEAASSGSVVETGSVHGGGMDIEEGGRLLPGDAHLLISKAGVLNSKGETGQILMNQSVLSFESTSPEDQFLYAGETDNTATAITVDLTGGGNLVIASPLRITRRLVLESGNVQSGGNLRLTASQSSAAFVESDGNGNVTGDVVVELRVPGGAQRRLISFPVDGVTVSELQEHIPVTGPFDGATNGETSPSLFEYDYLSNSWVPYPRYSNEEMLAQGSGYAIDFPASEEHHLLAVSGTVALTDFEFSLNPNGESDPHKGWHLIGNPFTAPIRWGREGWTASSVSSAAYVLDDAYPGGRYLVWDGETGDREFGGLIGRGQGFFVRTTGSAPGLAVSSRASVDTTARVFRTQSDEKRLTITLSQGSLTDRAYVRFAADGNDHIDFNDAVKMSNGYFNLTTLSADGVALAINSSSQRICGKALFLSVRGTSPGSYALAFEGSVFDETVSAQLIDRYTQDSVLIAAHGEYAFEVSADPATFGDNRFTLEFSPDAGATPVISREGSTLVSSSSSGNQWFLNGEKIEGATGQGYTPYVSGTYTVAAGAGGCTRASDPVTFIVTGIERRDEVVFFPNPANDKIHFNRLPPGTTRYRIVSASGLELQRGTIGESDGTIDLEALAPGVHVLILSNRESITRMKIVIR